MLNLREEPLLCWLFDDKLKADFDTAEEQRILIAKLLHLYFGDTNVRRVVDSSLGHSLIGSFEWVEWLIHIQCNVENICTDVDYFNKNIYDLLSGWLSDCHTAYDLIPNGFTKRLGNMLGNAISYLSDMQDVYTIIKEVSPLEADLHKSQIEKAKSYVTKALGSIEGLYGYFPFGEDIKLRCDVVLAWKD